MTTPASPSSTQASATLKPPRPPAAPPEWPIEGVIKRIGRVPAAAGRALDRAAKVPVLGWVVRRFSSVWMGITLLTLIAAYVAIGSGKPELRAYFEMTDLQFFDAWPMRVLLAMLALDLSIVTLRRIPLTLFKLGSWTVHIGILTLITGCVLYFSQKHEGSLRIYLNKSVDYSYDVTERALYAFPMNADGSFDAEHPTITSLPTLPIYAEHLASRGNGLNIELPGALGLGNEIVRVKGYYPCAVLQPAGVRLAAAGEKGQGPAVAFAMTAGKEEIPENWLLGDLPARRNFDMNDLPFTVEYLRKPTAQRLKELQTSFVGSQALTVRIPKLNIEKTYIAREGVPIVVEGSAYTLKPLGAMSMPVVAPEYQRAVSSLMRVEVVRNGPPPLAAFSFERQCVSRFPELSRDMVDEDGKRVSKKGGADSDIEIVYQDATRTAAYIVEGEDGKLQLIIRTVEGASTTQDVEMGKAVELPVRDIPGLKLKVTRKAADVVEMMEPMIVPVEQRRLGQTVMDIIQMSMVELDVAGRKVNVPFSSYAAIGDPPVGERPAVVDVGGKKVGLLLSTMRRKLPSTVTLTKFEPIKYKGAQRSYLDYISTLSARDEGQTESRTLVTHLNNPASDHGLYYFQAAWDGDDNAPAAKRFSVIGVANRPGIPVMVVGSLLMIAGVFFAFYAKPILLKAKKESLAKWAEQRSKSGTEPT